MMLLSRPHRLRSRAPGATHSGSETRKRTAMVGLRLLPSEKAALKAAADEKDLAVPDLISMCLVKQGIKMMESNPHSSMPADNNDRPVDHLEQLYRAALIAEAEDLAHGLHHLSIATGDPETDDDINRITQLAGVE